MTGYNHFAVGAVIGLTLKEPLLVAPLALISHYVCDALPHFGFRDWDERKKYLFIFRRIVIVDVFILFALVAFLVSKGAPGILFVGGLFAVLPDFAWVYRYIVQEKFGTIEPKKRNILNEFHAKIQRYERVWGIWVELAVIAALLPLILALLP